MQQRMASFREGDVDSKSRDELVKRLYIPPKDPNVFRETGETMKVSDKQIFMDLRPTNKEVSGMTVRCPSVSPTSTIEEEDKENVGDMVDADVQNYVNLRKMNANRRSLRSSRCRSTIVTEKEKKLLLKQEDKEINNSKMTGSPKASSGFVKSMCRFYNEVFGGDKKKGLDRSVSFSGQTKRRNSVGLEPITERSSSEHRLVSSPVSSRSGSFRLNRSRSWRGSRRGSVSESSYKRSSPTGHSVKSQDSGFSDSGESQNQCEVLDDRSQSADSADIAEDEEEELVEEEERRDQFVSKIHIYNVSHEEKSAVDNEAQVFRAVSLSTISTPLARDKVSASLGNVMSIQEGLRLKLEGEPRAILNEGSVAKDMFQRRCNSASTLIHSINSEAREKLRRGAERAEIADGTRMVQDSEPDFNVSNVDAGPVFSTPVRASFRRRPKTMILEEAQTPVKRESRTKLKEIKNRRRWSNIERDSRSSNYARIPDLHESEPSLVGLWAQFAPYEPTLSTNLSPKVPSLGVQSCLSPSINSQLSLLSGQSFTADGTASRLMLDSYTGPVSQVTSPLTSHTLTSPMSSHPLTSPLYSKGSSHVVSQLNCDTIIEHETANYQPILASGSMENFETDHRPRSSLTHPDPVYEWWRDLFVWTEPECMTYLQSKPIVVSHESVKNINIATNDTLEMVRTIQRSARTVLVTFNTLRSHFAALNLVQMSKTIQTLTGQIQDFIYEYNLGCYSDPCGAGTMDNRASEFPGYKTSNNSRPITSPKTDGLTEIVNLQQKVVLQVVDRLKLCAERCQYTPQQPLVEMKKCISHLDQAYVKLVDLVISKEVKAIIDVVERGDVNVTQAVNVMINLGNEHSSQIYSIISKFSGIRFLVALTLTSSSKEVKLLALRAISSICCTVDCIRDLERCGGVNIISSILVNPSNCLETKVEAAGVLAQITSPWISDNHKVVGLKAHVASLVAQLTAMSRLHCGDDSFLLVTAALANLTFMESSAVSCMRVHSTARTLVRAVHASPFVSMFAKDQVVTVLANMAADPACRADILQEDGLCFLVELLGTSVDSAGNAAELAAAERVLKKTAIALSRLCTDPALCEELISLQGVEMLVNLCKDGNLRNYNDAVLVASLAVLRRVATHCGLEVFEAVEARDLIEPKLVDSFLEYSSKQESYV